ncbi:hypothetical protein [[Eubacterium] cellulosolvens]
MHMKCLNFIVVFILLTIIFSPIFLSHVEAQCESTNLSENSKRTRYNQSRPRIAVNGDVVHVVWEDNTQGSDIIYRRSNDGGNTWDSSVAITNNHASQQNPDITAYGDNVYVVWEDKRNFDKTGSDIYIKHSKDGGNSWEAEEQLTFNANQWDPRIAAYDKYVHLTWLDERNMASTNYDIYYRQSSDYGVSWNSEQRLTSNPSIQWRQSIAAYGDYVYVVYEDHREWHYPPGGSKGIIVYYARSADSGETWSTENRLPTEGAWQQYPDVAAIGNRVYITWSDFRAFFDTWLDIWIITSIDYGETWLNDTRITTDSKIQNYPRIAIDDETIHLVWQDLRDAEYSGMDLYYTSGDLSATNWEMPIKLSEYQWQYDQAITASNERAHIVWTDEQMWETNGKEVFHCSR